LRILLINVFILYLFTETEMSFPTYQSKKYGHQLQLRKMPCNSNPGQRKEQMANIAQLGLCSEMVL